MVTEKTKLSKMAIDAEIWVTGAANNISTQIRQLDIQTEMYTVVYYSRIYQ